MNLLFSVLSFHIPSGVPELRIHFYFFILGRCCYTAEITLVSQLPPSDNGSDDLDNVPPHLSLFQSSSSYFFKLTCILSTNSGQHTLRFPCRRRYSSNKSRALWFPSSIHVCSPTRVITCVSRLLSSFSFIYLPHPLFPLGFSFPSCRFFSIPKVARMLINHFSDFHRSTWYTIS